MDLNDLLRTCDYNDVRARAMLLDELHEQGRAEEEALIGRAGLSVAWQEEDLFASVSLDMRPSCPFCPHPFQSHPVRLWSFCQHAVFVFPVAGDFDATQPACLEEFLSEANVNVLTLLQRMLFTGCPVVPQWEDDSKIADTAVVVMTNPMDGGEGHRYPLLVAPYPRRFLARLSAFLEQRERAGCPVVLPPLDAPAQASASA